MNTEENRNPASLEGTMTGGGLELPGREDLKPEQILSNSLKDMANLAAREGKAAGRAGSLGFFEERGMAPEDLPGSSVQKIVALADQAMVDPVAQRGESIGQLVESIAVQRDQTMQVADKQIAELQETNQWNDFLDKNPDQARELWTMAGRVGKPYGMVGAEPEVFGTKDSGYYQQKFNQETNSWEVEQIIPAVSEGENGYMVQDEEGETYDFFDKNDLKKLKDKGYTYEQVNTLMDRDVSEVGATARKQWLYSNGFIPEDEKVRTKSDEGIKLSMLEEVVDNLSNLKGAPEKFGTYADRERFAEISNKIGSDKVQRAIDIISEMKADGHEDKIEIRGDKIIETHWRNSVILDLSDI